MSSKDEEHATPAQPTNGENDKREQQGGEDEQKGLFDQPLIMEGKRKRKSTEHFAFTAEKKRQSTGKYTGGSGCKLGDIAFVEYQISHHKANELKVLHRLCFDRSGTKTEIKKNLRNFNGWGFDEDSDQYKRKRTAMEKFTTDGLKRIMKLLGLPLSGTKDELINALMGFVWKPVDNGQAVPTAKKRRKSSSGGKGSSKVRKHKISDSEEEEVEMEEDNDEEEEEEEEEMDQEADEEEEINNETQKVEKAEGKSEKCSPDHDEIALAITAASSKPQEE